MPADTATKVLNGRCSKGALEACCLGARGALVLKIQVSFERLHVVSSSDCDLSFRIHLELKSGSGKISKEV